jgi:hypothetical protein
MAKQTAKKIKRIKKILKGEIHHNRWFIWAVVFSVVFSIVLVAYIEISDINFSTSFLPQNEFKSDQAYKDTRLGFFLHYPAGWIIEAENDKTINFAPPTLYRGGVSITVLDPKSEKSFLKTLDIVKEQSVNLDGYKGTKIYNSILGRGFESVVILKTEKKLFILRGDDVFVNRALLTFKILN